MVIVMKGGGESHMAVGIPEPEAGELPKAFVVKKHGHQVTKDDIHAMVKGG